MTIQPRVAWITTNRSCNFRCSWCYARAESFDEAQSLDWNLARKQLGIIRALGIKNVLLIGGEPTLWRHLLKFNAECRKNGITTTLVTNAQRFSDDRFWAQYIESPNDHVGPSLKAYDARSMKTLTGVRNFDATGKGLSRVIKRYKCGVSFVISDQVKDHLVAMARYARACGAKFISISPCTPALDGSSVDTGGMLSLPQLVEAFTEHYPLIHDIMDGGLLFAIKSPLCVWPRPFIDILFARGQLATGCQFRSRSGIVFGTSGELLACNSMAKYPLGALGTDFDDAETLLALLNDESVTQAYRHLNSYASTKCIDCSQRALCQFGCPLIWTAYDAEESIPGWQA